MNRLQLTHPTDPQQSKRRACDRCRAQKLKCVRSEFSRICESCNAVNSACIFGSPRAPGRPPTGGRAPRECVQKNRTGSTTSIHHSPSILRPAPSRQVEFSADDHQHSPSSKRARGPIPPQIGLPTQEEARRERQSRRITREGNGPFSMFCDVGGTIGVVAPVLGESLAPVANPQELMSGTPIAGAFEMATGQTSLPGDHTHKSLAPMASPTGSLLERLIPPGESPAAAQTRRMQHLLQLGAVMYELQDGFNQSQKGPTQPGTSNPFPDHFAGQLLQIAIAFLKSLRCFSVDQAPSSKPASAPRTGPEISSHQLDSLKHPTSFTRVPPDPAHEGGILPADGPSPIRNNLAADKPAVLQLIACYMGLLQLYCLLYYAILDHVRSTAAAGHSRKPIWSDLCIGGTSLSLFSDCQIKLVLQVAEHLLGEIESTLGLSEACRVSKRRPREGSGTLCMNVSAHFIEMCMCETLPGAEDGQTTIARLRDARRALSGLLDGPVCLNEAELHIGNFHHSNGGM